MKERLTSYYTRYIQLINDKAEKKKEHDPDGEQNYKDIRKTK